MAKRLDIYDPQIPPRIHPLAVSATQRLLGEPVTLTATFRGRRYSITEEPSDTTNSILVQELPTGNSIRATTTFDQHHLPLTLDITVTTRRGVSNQRYEREPRRSDVGTPPLSAQPLIDTLRGERQDIAVYALYVAERVLADAARARRSRTTKFDPDPHARGIYENDQYKEVPEYSQR